MLVTVSFRFVKPVIFIIADGRVGSDADIGNLTRENASVVDNAVVSHSLFDLLDTFCVLDFSAV